MSADRALVMHMCMRMPQLHSSQVLSQNHRLIVDHVFVQHVRTTRAKREVARFRLF